MTLSQGALVEPMSVAFSGVIRSGVQPGETALVLGAGPIGIGIVLGLQATGVENIIVVEPATNRRAAMASLGVEAPIDPAQVDLVSEVRRRTGGEGVHGVLDSSGAATSFEIAPAVLRPRGRYVALSFLGGEVAFAPWVLPRSEIELTGSCGYDTATFTRVIELINAGAFRAEAWVEHVGLDEVVPAFEDLQAGRRLKVLVDLS